MDFLKNLGGGEIQLPVDFLSWRILTDLLKSSGDDLGRDLFFLTWGMHHLNWFGRNSFLYNQS